jgi:hypothetical protein
MMGIELPDDVVAKRTAISPTSFAYTFSHHELGELGSVLLCAGHGGAYHITHQMRRSPEDTQIDRRRALFDPIVEAMAMQLSVATRV